MKNHLTQVFVFLLLIITMSGCSVVGDIFEAGLWVGVIIVILVIAIVFWIIKKLLG